MKTARATLDINVWVECPTCEAEIDLLDEDDTAGVAHNDEGHVIKQACPSDGHWSTEHEKFEVTEVECSKCGVEFNVAGIDW